MNCKTRRRRPAYLYKYMPFNDLKKCIYGERGERVERIIKIIVDKSIFIPLAIDLNDPFEQAIDHGEWEEENEIETLKRVIEWRERQKNIRVLSLSSDYKSMLLWAHYSFSHKGICFEFSNASDFFKPVRYETSFPSEIEAFPFVKSCDWKYEKEFRFVNSSPAKYIKLQDIGLSISSLILGSSFEDWEIFGKEILPILDGIPVYKMRTSLKDFQLERFPFEKDKIYKILALGDVEKKLTKPKHNG